jgi:hypothetical protein
MSHEIKLDGLEWMVGSGIKIDVVYPTDSQAKPFVVYSRLNRTMEVQGETLIPLVNPNNPILIAQEVLEAVKSDFSDPERKEKIKRLNEHLEYRIRNRPSNSNGAYTDSMTQAEFEDYFSNFINTTHLDDSPKDHYTPHWRRNARDKEEDVASDPFLMRDMTSIAAVYNHHFPIVAQRDLGDGLVINLRVNHTRAIVEKCNNGTILNREIFSAPEI